MVERIKLVNFRNYPETEFNLSQGVNLVVGPNASGKTNLLEALFLLGATKSFRASDTELIKYGQNFYRIEATNDDVLINLGFENAEAATKKQVKVSGKKRSLSEYLGTVLTVLFEPNDLSLLSGPPEKRRKHLDYILCQTDRTYLKELVRYRKILRQRNRLLENFSIGSVKDQIFAWDLQLAEAALVVYNRRTELIRYFNEIADDLYADIAGQKVGLNLVYQPTVEGEYGEQFMPSLARNLTPDLAAGFTTIGPHREDFKLNFNNREITSTASRGETRTAVLVLKLAELAYTENKAGKKPMLLRDDVFSELDESRRNYLIKKLAGYQSLVTTTDLSSLGEQLPEFNLIPTSPPKRTKKTTKVAEAKHA